MIFEMSIRMEKLVTQICDKMEYRKNKNKIEFSFMQQQHGVILEQVQRV